MKKQRFSYAFFLLAALVFFIYYPGYLSHLLLIFMIVLPAFSLLSILPLCFVMKFDLKFETAIASKHEALSYILTIHNNSCFPCGYASLTLYYENVLDNAFGSKKIELKGSIAPLDTAVLHSKISFQYCGKIKLFLKKARLYDPLRLFAVPVQTKLVSDVRASAYIMPNIEELNPSIPLIGFSESESKTYALWKSGYDPSEIFQMRDYQPGDRFQKIHWKLGQRFDTLIVKDFSLPENYFVNFLIDFDKYAAIEAVDRMMDAFASVSVLCLEQQIPFTVTWAEKRFLTTETVTREDDFVPVLRCVLGTQGAESHEALVLFDRNMPEHTGGHLIYIIDGTADDVTRGKMTAGHLSYILQKKQYESITVLMAGHNPEMARDLNSAGCLVYTLEDIDKKERRLERDEESN